MANRQAKETRDDLRLAIRNLPSAIFHSCQDVRGRRSVRNGSFGTLGAAPIVPRKNNLRAADPKRIIARRARFGIVPRDIFHKFIANGKRHFVTVVRRGATFILMKAIMIGSEIAFTIHIKTIA